MPRHQLTDSQWALLEPLLPRNGSRGGQWKDHRVVLDGMFYRLNTGVPWRDLPLRFGSWQTVWDRFNRWSGDGTLERVASALLRELDETDLLDWSLWNIDASNIRAAHAAAGAPTSAYKKGRPARS